MPSRILPLLLVPLILSPASQAEEPSREEAEHALRAAVEFFHWEASAHGAYVWRSSSDLTYRRGEAVVGPTTAWVQPPGTPSVGEAMLDAFLATDDPLLLDAARDAGYALCRGQMRSGGWAYSIAFDPAERLEYGYRENPPGANGSKRDRRWTTLDDDTTQASVRFLVRLDAALAFQDSKIHEAAEYALESILRAQHPNGGWYVWWEKFPEPPSEAEYPVIPASFPETWKREWPNDWLGRYVLNDNLMSDMIDTLLLAHRTYDDPNYLAASEKAGDFLILSQMPDPQPAWAQQYNDQMHPEWSRKFEPPAISGGESQEILRALMRLHAASGEERFLGPIPKALDYLRQSELPDGRLARFYELKTNRPLYFTKEYQLTYDPDDMPTHYGFIVNSSVDRIAAEYERIRAHGPVDEPSPRKAPTLTPELARKAREVIDAMDDRGAWVEEAENGSPILESATFARNVRVLADYIVATKGAAESR
jgi:hypothetical protein